MLFDDWAQEQTLQTTPSHATVNRVWEADWCHVLPFRRESEHKVCDECTWHREWRKREDPESQAGRDLKCSFVNHNKSQMRDRRVDALIRDLASDNLQKPTAPIDELDDILDFMIDGIEQAKFKLPRYAASRAKQAQGMWRPQLHVTGCTMTGLREIWYLTSALVPKNASTQITYLMDALGVACEDLASRGRRLPKIYRICADNATAETKNQIVFKWLCTIVFKDWFPVAELNHLRPGHTHNDQDRRFSVATTAIARCCSISLENMEDIKDLFLNKVREMQGNL